MDAENHQNLKFLIEYGNDTKYKEVTMKVKGETQVGILCTESRTDALKAMKEYIKDFVELKLTIEKVKPPEEEIEVLEDDSDAVDGNDL